jgi:hypothetical protein
MKKLSFIAIACLLLFGSCQKENGQDNNYHVSFTVDGVNKKYTGYVFAHLDTISGYVELSTGGADSPVSFDNYIGFYINNSPGNSNITSGQYEDNSAGFTVLSTYAVNSVEYEAGQSVAEDAVFYNVTIPNHFKVIITSMDKKTMRGTFSGDYYKNGDVRNGPKVSITNGDFYLKFL